MTGKGVEKPEIVIGSFYETPDGRIAQACQWNAKTKTVVSFFDEEGYPRETVSEFEFLAGWKRRADLEDFPNARDPRLPYTFDLCWDVKTRAGLVAFLGQGEDEADVRDAMVQDGVVLTDVENEEVARIRAENVIRKLF